jgi:hypothetical protein
MPAENTELMAVGGIPDPNGTVGAAGYDLTAIAIERRKRNRLSMAGQFYEFLRLIRGLVDAPDARRTVIACGDDPIAVVAKLHGSDAPSMSRQNTWCGYSKHTSYSPMQRVEMSPVKPAQFDKMRVNSYGPDGRPALTTDREQTKPRPEQTKTTQTLRDI